jgi:hypothetical protein
MLVLHIVKSFQQPAPGVIAAIIIYELTPQATLTINLAMNINSFNSFAAWKAFAFEFLCRIMPKRTELKAEPSWPLPAEKLSGITIQWPQYYDWSSAKIWMQSLRKGLKSYVHVEPANIEQPFNHVVLFRIRSHTISHMIGIDYSDHASINPECVKRCSLYFRMQYANTGYANQQILPGGFVTYPALYGFLPHVRTRDRTGFDYDVYGRFGRELGADIRAKAVNLLCSQRLFRYEGQWETVRYSRSLREIMRSKICIDLPGQGALCFRLVDYLAVGTCIIAYPHSNRLHVPLVPGRHIVYTKPDLSDLVKLCTYYLEHNEARQQMAKNARDYFDKYLNYSQLACYYLHQIISRLCL